MKKAFTILEIVFVIAIVGILSIVIIPRFGANNLNDAASQVVSHIRYTQHLAMNNDKYNPNDQIWYEKKWRIEFSQTGGLWGYTIFDDRLLSASGNPDPDEIAINPVDKNKRLTGGCSGISSTDPRATKEMNLENKYSIRDIVFSSDCGGQTITFDHLGRPIRGGTSSMTNPYDLTFISDTCQIDLCMTNCATASADDKISIKIEPETGYTCVLNSDGNCTSV
jgi:hypothetical protein